jgi:hypothetical protein
MEESLTTAINEGKSSDSQGPPRDRLGALRLALRGQILDELPFFAYLTHEYGAFHSDKQSVEQADWEQSKLSEFFAHVLPFTKYLLMTSAELRARCDSVHMAADGRASSRHAWVVVFGGILINFVAPGKITTNDGAQSEIVKSKYEEFFKATQPE